MLRKLDLQLTKDIPIGLGVCIPQVRDHLSPLSLHLASLPLHTSNATLPLPTARDRPPLLHGPMRRPFIQAHRHPRRRDTGPVEAQERVERRRGPERRRGRERERGLVARP